ncbi:WPP domain-associated protein isoform X1 [Phoenix dactylifera]|uniref:WPP domain-associated protein isoform X1 n=2 Tax=Phoenix dactylifera TaxID=42345 RepID=A0A8B7C9J0_PHODC|nr:WPP domain-associated protein isoform X1 [Phoenix dactylifera]
MDRIESSEVQLPVENSEIWDERAGTSAYRSLSSSRSFKGNGNIENDSVFYEKFLLDDLDSYWDEINDRLSISRMVSESVFKGIINALVEEAAEKIDSKEAEIAILNERLQSCKSDAAISNRLASFVMLPKSSIEIDKTKSELHQSCLDASVDLNYPKRLGRLKLAAEEQLHRLQEDLQDLRTSNSHGRITVGSTDSGMFSIFPMIKAEEKLLEIDEQIDGLKIMLELGFAQINDIFWSMKASMWEQHWVHEFQREISNFMIQYYIKGLHDEFETKLYEQRGLVNTLIKNSQEKFTELASVCEELDAISKSLFSSDNSHESFEEWSVSKRKELFPGKVLGNHHFPSHAEENGTIIMEKSGDSGTFMMGVADLSQLKHMTKEELVSFFKTEMTKLRRQHESALQEKTEELFRLKREFLKEKGSSHFRKDKESELLKRKIPEVILKLNGILLEKEKLPPIRDDHDEICHLKYRIDSLFLENQGLQSLLLDKNREVKHLYSQVSDTASQMLLHSSVEANFLKQIMKFKGDLEDVKMETNIRDEFYNVVLRELICEHQCRMEDIKIETICLQEIYSVIIKGIAWDVISTINPAISKYYTEKASLETRILEKDKALRLEIEEKQKLKQTIASISTVMKEKEKLAVDTGSTLMQQKKQFDLVHQELSLLRDQVCKQDVLISDFKKKSHSMESRLNEALQQIHQYELETNKLNEKLKSAADALEKAGKQKAVLHDMVEEKQKSLSLSDAKGREQAKELECIIVAVMELSKAAVDFESILAEKIKSTESRLKILSHQFEPLVKQAILLEKKESWFKQMLEIRCSNFQKAEAEVDLLGDEVDALLGLLGKIYIALDHYSPVLQHYPGVMEILKLVQRELKGENI